MNEVSTHLKNTLRSLRVKFGYTQGEAAILLEISVPTLRAWECNSGGVPYKKILKIEEVYNTSQDYIFFGDEDSFGELIRKPGSNRRGLHNDQPYK